MPIATTTLLLSPSPKPPRTPPPRTLADYVKGAEPRLISYELAVSDSDPLRLLVYERCAAGRGSRVAGTDGQRDRSQAKPWHPWPQWLEPPAPFSTCA